MTDDGMVDDASGRLRGVFVLAAVVLTTLAGVSYLVAPAAEEPEPLPTSTAGPDDIAAPTQRPEPTGDARSMTPDAPLGGDGPSLAFSSTGLAGGGFQNVVAFAPDGSSALIGGDVSGLHRSVDGGLTWLPVGPGLPRWAEKIAAIAYHPTDPDRVVAAGGFAGRSGGVLRSDDGGVTWSVATEQVFFSGQHSPDIDADVPTGHPRATGRLLVWVGDTLLAGTFDDGLQRSTDGGRTWAVIGMDGVFIRGLAVDAGGRLLVATYGDGLWAVADPAGAATAARVHGGPRAIEEVAVDGEVVLAAAGRDGLWTWSQDAGWALAEAGQTTWTTVAADGGRWLAGSHEPDRVEDIREPGVARSTDNGASWTHVATGDSLHLEVLGTGGQWWWVEQASRRILPDGGDWTAGQFAFDPSDGDRVLLAGRAGVWASSDGGASWNPSVVGLGATVSDGAAVAADGRVAITNTDHRLLLSDDELRSVVAVEPGATEGTAIAADATGPPGTLLVATGERDANTDGELFRIPAGTTDTVPLGLAAQTGGKRVMAITTGADVDGTGVVVVAVEDDGIWRLVDGTWSRATGEAFAPADQITLDADAVWVPGTQVVLVLDRTRGVFRSRDAGRSFELLQRLTTNTDRITPTGFLALDPSAPDRLWVSHEGGLFRVNGVTGDGPNRTDVEVPVPGPVLALPDGGLLVVTRDDELGTAPRLLQVCAGAVVDVRTGPRFHTGAVDAIDLDLDASGHLIVTTANSGVIRSVVPVADAVRCLAG